MAQDASPPQSVNRSEADYRAVVDDAKHRVAHVGVKTDLSENDRQALYQRCQALVDAMWDAFGSADGMTDTGYSWVGVYYGPGESLPERMRGDGARTTVPEDEMLLGPCRNKPACSPIGLHGMCGASWLHREAKLVRDVRELGDNYIACDPADQSELVLPLRRLDGAGNVVCWGVLDIDSYAVDAFTDGDMRWAAWACEQLGLDRSRSAG